MSLGKNIVDSIGCELVRYRRKREKALCILISNEARSEILRSISDGEINLTKSRTLFGIPLAVSEQLEQPYLVVLDKWGLLDK